MDAVVPPFGHDELNRIPQELADPIRQVWTHAADPESKFWDQTGTRMCSWFDLTTKTCTHYDIRPNACRDLAVGGSDCMDWRRRHRIDTPVSLSISAKKGPNS